MADSRNKQKFSDELYTITLHDHYERGEKIPERKSISTESSEEIIKPGDSRPNEIRSGDNRSNEIRSGDSWSNEIRSGGIRSNDIQSNISENKQQKNAAFISRIQSQLKIKGKDGAPPVLTTASLLVKQEYHKPVFNQSLPKNKSFIELAREYADRTHEKTKYIPFMSYWPSYEFMSEGQLNWYFYFRSRLRDRDYIDSELSYLFVHIYELINQIGVDNPDDGLNKLISIWKNYRDRFIKLDNYLTDWIGDYINLYKCDAGSAFELLKTEGLFLLMPSDLLADYHFNKNLTLPVELIARFCDYKFYESGFIKGEQGSMFMDNLSGLIDDIRRRMDREKEGNFYFKEMLITGARQYKRRPFQRAVFHNPTSILVYSYPPYETYKPFRKLITAIIKEFENQLRIKVNYKGRLRPEKLPDDIKAICIKFANEAFDRSRREQVTEITIDRERLFALIKDSDEVRKRLSEGIYEYDGEHQPGSAADDDTIGQVSPGGAETAQVYTTGGADDAQAYVPDGAEDVQTYAPNGAEDVQAYAPDGAETTQAYTSDSAEDAAPASSAPADYENAPHASLAPPFHGGIEATSPATPALHTPPAPVSFAPPASAASDGGSGSFMSGLTPVQREILEFILSKGGSCTNGEIGTAFPGVFVSVEVDKINDSALSDIGDLLIGFENDTLYIMEDYIDEINVL